MILEKAHERIAMYPSLDSGYNRNSAGMVLGKVMRDHVQQAVDDLIREYVDTQREIKLGAKFEIEFKS